MKNYTDVFLLKGKNVFMVGGLGLLGLAAAKAMAACGAKVIILDINAGKAKAALSWAKKNKYRLFYEYFDVYLLLHFVGIKVMQLNMTG